jgi:glycosyltransferase involved in cell wall biosynthesis
MTQKIRVVMIITAYHPIVGGAERQLGALAPRMLKMGLDIHIITRRYKGLASFEVVDGIPVHRISSPGPMALASLLFTINALLLILKLRPDIIHAHELLSPTTTSVLANLLLHTPVIAKVLGGGKNGDISKLQRNPVSAIRVSTILKRVSKFIVISREIENELESIGIPQKNIAFIPNGVDLDHFHPISTIHEKRILRQNLQLPPDFLAVYTGRLDIEKNVQTLVSIWPEIRSSNPQAYLLIIGTGSEEESIKSNIGEGIIIMGMKKDVLPYLQVADLFVLPSTREGLSNAILESMACGLPVVAFAVGGNPELIKPDQTGLLADPKEPNSLKHKIIQLMKNEPLRREMGIKGRQFVTTHYSINKTLDSLTSLYFELINQKNASTH